jgi:hypothetical protein
MKAPPTTFLFFNVVYKCEERVSEAFGHFYAKNTVRPPENASKSEHLTKRG